MNKNFLSLVDIGREDLVWIIDQATKLKNLQKAGTLAEDMRIFTGKTLLMIFELASTRTRISFEIGFQRLGGHVIALSSSDMQLGRGETIADTARVLGGYGDIVLLRTDDHQNLLDFAAYSPLPVINGLSPDGHPCQIIADLLTLQENLGTLTEKRVLWCGDGNNVCLSWIDAAGKLGFFLDIACPEKFFPDQERIALTNRDHEWVRLIQDPFATISQADCVVTDTWISMGEKKSAQEQAVFYPYQVNERLMEKAPAHAIFLHCLPAHRNQEVSDAVIDGPASRVWQEAENRLYAQQAIMKWCLS